MLKFIDCIKISHEDIILIVVIINKIETNLIALICYFYTI